MGQLLVRGLDDKIIQALKQRAMRAGRSVEAEHRTILEHVLTREAGTFAEAAAQLRAQSPAQTSDSAALLRLDRDRNRGS